MYRTPGYVSWQGNNWVAHCSDYCAFIAMSVGVNYWSEALQSNLKILLLFLQ